MPMRGVTHPQRRARNAVRTKRAWEMQRGARAIGISLLESMLPSADARAKDRPSPYAFVRAHEHRDHPWTCAGLGCVGNSAGSMPRAVCGLRGARCTVFVRVSDAARMLKDAEALLKRYAGDHRWLAGPWPVNTTWLTAERQDRIAVVGQAGLPAGGEGAIRPDPPSRRA